MPLTQKSSFLAVCAALAGVGHCFSCQTPAPVTPAVAAGHHAEELRGAITQLEWTMDSADRAGLLALQDDADAAIARRDELQSFLAAFYDGVRGVDALAGYYDEREGDEAFLLNYVAELAIYLNLAALMDRTVQVAHYETLFSEVRPELGLQEGSWRELKNAFNLQPWNKPLGLLHLRYQSSQDRYAELGLQQRYPWAIGYVDAHSDDLVRTGVSTGPKVFALDSLERVTEGLHFVWFPVQKQVAETLGDTRVVAADRRLISDAQVQRAVSLLRPGDVIVERRNWYLSNIGLPGFWPHSALYIGTPQELAAEFTEEFVAGLEAQAPKAVATWRQRDADGHPTRILEAVSEGVVFSSAEHSLGADHVAALRPTLSLAERGAMLRDAFGYFGRPYDFDFDFRTDDALVCSELVFKAYAAGSETSSVPLPLETILGRPVLSPNRLVAHYDAHAADPHPPFRFVFFLDGVESEGRAHFRDEATLRVSHLRPKWDIAQP